MFTMFSRMSLLLIAAFASIEFASGVRRDLDYTFNEECKEICKNTKVRLGHITARGPNDTLHYLWDFTRNPTVFIALTSHKAKLVVNWHDYIASKANSLNFTEKPAYTFGMTIERLLEFNDLNDQGRIDEISDKNIVELNLQDFQWEHKNMSITDNFVQFYSEANNYKDSTNNETRKGSISFLMHAFNTLNHSHVMPCMLHSENATQMDIIINNLDTKQNFTKSRFAFELLIVSQSNPLSTLNVDTKRKLDDEFTPGIFEVMELSAPVENEHSAYLQWRPVSYISPDRDVTNSTSTIFYSLKNATANNYFAVNNLLYMYYGENLFNNLVQRVNISLGVTGDPFYNSTKYATWTFITGYGNPPNERFSSIVIMIICIGLGIPIIMLLVSGIYICVRRRQTNGEFVPR